MAGRPWADSERRLMELLWGQAPLKTIAHRLGRTPYGVEQQARALGLRSPRNFLGLVTLRALERSTGYDRRRLQNAIELLGLRPKRITVMDPASPRARRRGYTQGDVDQLLALLTSTPDAQRIYRPGGGKSPAGAWGVGRKPAACLDHGGTDRPHYAKGVCSRCYQRRLDAAGRQAAA